MRKQEFYILLGIRIKQYESILKKGEVESFESILKIRRNYILKNNYQDINTWGGHLFIVL